MRITVVTMLLHQLYSQTRKPCYRNETARCSVCFSQRLFDCYYYIFTA